MKTLERECLARFQMSDDQLAAASLGALPIHRSRSHATLLEWGRRAHRFGEQLGDEQPDRQPPTVIFVAEGGITSDQILLAQFRTRPETVVLFQDSINLAEQLIDWLEWRRWFPVGCVQRAASIHESFHARLHARRNRTALRRAVGHTTIAVGRVRRFAHIVGAEEIAAHGCVQRELGLERSPLLLTAALSSLAGQHESGTELPSRRTIEEQ